jgi:pyruvate dehydrogenase E2 component (dihydrolipoamide acetyltransferase)
VAYEFKLPDLGEGLTEGEIARWLVDEGQDVAEDEPLVEIATDKTTVEIPSPAGGTVSKILVGEGEVVPVGTVLVVIGGNGRPVSDTTQPVSDARVRATPLVRRLADQLGVDLERVTGSGPQGRITEQDVRGATEPREGRREPMRGIKRQMFEHLTRAHAVPTITWVEECDFTGVDLKLLVPLVLKACAESLKEYPELNARVEDHDLVYLDRYDIGVAV